MSSGIQYALFIVFTSVIFFYIDKTSRRGLLMYGALGMAACHFVVGGVLSSGEYVPNGVDGNLNVLIKVMGGKAHTVIAFSYLLIIVYALTLAPVAWVYAAEVWSLETRATGMVIISSLYSIYLSNMRTCANTSYYIGNFRRRKLALQLCSRSIRTPRLRQHHMEALHRLWRSLCWRRYSSLLHVSVYHLATGKTISNTSASYPDTLKHAERL